MLGLCNWKRKVSPLNYSVHRESFPYPIKRYKNMVIVNPVAGHLIGICLFVKILSLRCYFAVLVDTYQQAWSFSWKLNKKTEIPNDKYHVFIFQSVCSDRETFWCQQDIFTYGFILLFTDTLQLHLKLDPFPSLYFWLGFSCLQEHKRLSYMTTLQPLLIKWSN